jgi:TolA-binding protein
MSWDAASATFVLQMRSGSVVVRGPGIESGVEVKGTERFVSHARARVERGPPSATPPASVEVPAAELEGAPAEKPHAAEPSASSSSELGQPQSFTQLAKKGDYRRIVAAAEERGFESALGASSASDLAALADATRYVGRADLSRRAFAAMRRRFPASSGASNAAFVLGRMEDEAGNAGAALSWYETYLSEAPAGSLAAEALGRRMLAQRKLGQIDASRRAAEDYLRRFPNGAYAEVARELVGH